MWCDVFVAQVSYNVRLKVEKLTSDVLNSDCECPAGKGPQGTTFYLQAHSCIVADAGEVSFMWQSAVSEKLHRCPTDFPSAQRTI